MDIANPGLGREGKCRMGTRRIEKPADAFLPIVGQVAWSVRRGYGTFLTIEFGSPHIVIREPIVASSDASDRVKRNLAKRRVSIVGDWHFWVQYAQWELETANYSLRSENAEVATLDEALNELDGQYLLSAAAGAMPASCILRFDLGASLLIWPSLDFDDVQWSLHEMGKNIVSCDSSGNIIFDNVSGRQGS